MLSILKHAAQRILSKQGEDRDYDLIRDGLLAGQVIVSEVPGKLEIDGDNDGIASSGNNNVLVQSRNIVLNLSEADSGELRRALFPSLPGAPPPSPPLRFVGRTRDIANIKEHLSDTAKAAPAVVVDGWPGVGKTSLSSMIGHIPDLAQHYPDGILWASLGVNPSLYGSLAAWQGALQTAELVTAPSLSVLSQRLRSRIGSRRFLLIIDDVWHVADVGPILAARGHSTGVLMTTRKPEVVQALVNEGVTRYRLAPLDSDDGLSLFRSLAPEVVARDETLCRDLVEELERLPLALHVAGRLLRTEHELGWGIENLIQEIRSGAAIIAAEAPSDRAEEGVLPTVSALLARSTDFLDQELRSRFALLSLFTARPATFDLGAMEALWKVQDGRPFIRKLVDHGLLEPVLGGRFQMHSLLSAHARSLLGSL